MAVYYGVKKVLEKGQRIGVATEQMHFVKNTEVLVGIVKGSKYAVAVDLTVEKEYRAFYRACARGNWRDFDLYRLAKEKITECPDEGRVLIGELEPNNSKGNS
ncbi:hypothetical protein HZA73_00525 [candidate division TA06 bacterium]|nr:hypothetical protein [candidate division TA06 bacterium]